MAAHSYADIALKLADQIDNLAPHCLGAARRSTCGKYWECGGLDGRPGGKSWQLIVNRQRVGNHDRGRWKDFASGEAGDALNLVAETLCNGDLKRAYEWALGWLGLEGGQELTPAERQALTARRAGEAADRQRSAAAHERETQAKARALWLSGEPDLEGSPVDRYLLGRGIDVRRITPRPGALRFSWEVYCQEVREKLPAMLAAISRPGAGIIGCHRTYLQKGAGNHWAKAPLQYPKKVMGRAQGGLIPLARGASGKSWGKVRQPEPVMIGEGIEDTLSAAMHMPEIRAACGISLTNMGGLDPAWPISEVIMLGQNDPPDSDAAHAQGKAIARLSASGRRVRLALPPAGVKDWNDWAQAEQGAVA